MLGAQNKSPLDSASPNAPVLPFRALLFGSEDRLSWVFRSEQFERLRAVVKLERVCRTRQGSFDCLTASERRAEVLFGTWGMPVCDERFLDLLPELRAIFYAAGSARDWLHPEVWRRGIRVFTAAYANAQPVAEFAFAAAIFGLKRALPLARGLQGGDPWRADRQTIPGAFRSTVGIISLSRTGRRFCQLLRNLDVRIIACDPIIKKSVALEFVDELVELPELFARSNVVSLHAPALPETQGMISGKLLASLPPYASFINTARGMLLREDEIIKVLENRPDLFAFLDVTEPEPPLPGNPLLRLPNVLLTPHISGSLGLEQSRLAESILEDFARYQQGKVVASEFFEHEMAFSA